MKKKNNVPKEIKESAHKIWLAGLGALALAGEEGKAMFQALVERGEDFEARGKTQVDKVKGKVDDARTNVAVVVSQLSERFDESVAGALQRLGVPTRKEISTLTKRVEELTKSIEKIQPAKKAPARKPAVKPAKKAAEAAK